MSELWPEILAEFRRLGLRLDDSPYQAFAAGPGGAERFLESLRRFQPGVTWRDVFPDMPSHWIPGRPETWTHPYRPLGDFDYHEPPAGPDVHIYWPEGREDSPLEGFVALAIGAGWPVYGAGLVEELRSHAREFNAHVVLERGTNEDTFGEFLLWIERQPGVEIAVITRPVDEPFHE